MSEGKSKILMNGKIPLATKSIQPNGVGNMLKNTFKSLKGFQMLKVLKVWGTRVI